MMKIIMLLIVTALVSCDMANPTTRPGNSIEVPKNGNLFTTDNRILDKDIPPESINHIYLGNGWVTFEYNGQCFLMHDAGRASVLTKIDCHHPNNPL